MRDETKNLAALQCVPCRGGIPPLEEVKIQELLPQITGWTRIEEDGIKKIRKEFMFEDFREAMDFVNRVGAIADEQDHHPDIFIQWNRVVFTLWTHAIDGLHDNDFIIAAKIDELKARLGLIAK